MSVFGQFGAIESSVNVGNAVALISKNNVSDVVTFHFHAGPLTSAQQTDQRGRGQAR